MLSPDDIHRLKRFAEVINIPPYVLARSILLRGFKVEVKRFLVDGASLEAPILQNNPGVNTPIDQSSEVELK